MNNIKKVSIVALALFLIGGIGSFLTIPTINQAMTITEEKRINDNITDIQVNTNNIGVEVALTKEDTVIMELYGKEYSTTNYSYSAKVEGSTLLVNSEKNNYSWLNLFPTSLIVKIYLPEKQYESLLVDSNNGLVHVENSDVKDIKINTTNGLIDLRSINAVEIDAGSMNGQITMKDVDGNITGKTNNGQITIQTKSIDRSIHLETGAGRILLQTEQTPTNVTFDVHAGTGMINILGPDTGTIIGDGENVVKLRTETGSITVENY